MSNRLFINVPTGIIELEGEEGFIEAHFDKLLPLIEGSGFGSSADAVEDDGTAESPDSAAEESKVSDEGTRKRTRRGGSRTPKGHSCPDRMKTLRDEGFFQEKRTTSQIVEGLAARGWTHKSNQVSAAGGNMFDRGEIQRTKQGKGFAYFWDRE